MKVSIIIPVYNEQGFIKKSIQSIINQITKPQKVIYVNDSSTDETRNIINTSGEDLDMDQSAVKETNATVVTAFQIFEHLLNPFQLLMSIKANKLVCSVPLKLWFAKAYRNERDKRDNHFHEFEDWQFRLLLEKTGWKIVEEKKFTNPVKKIGLRPLLRLFTYRYLIIYAEKIN